MIDLRARPSVDFKEDSLVYEKSCVDAALAEKDKKIEGWKAEYSNLLNVDIPRIEANLKKRIADLEAALESEKASRYADSVDAGMRERRLKSALWLMGAECYSDKEKLARECACLNSYEDWNRFLKRKRTYEKWIDQLIRIAKLCEKLKTKCRAMAEKFGG